MDTKSKSFASWTISINKDDNSPYGDLARDILYDEKEDKWF